ncbi:nicotinamide N-methyltransferase-like [Anomaloglossus baeobatrachus]
MNRRTHDLIINSYTLCKIIPAAYIKTLCISLEGVALSLIQDETMDPSSYKLYRVDGFDSRQHLEDYMSDKPDMVFAEDTLIFPIENLLKTFTEGNIKEDVMIDLSAGSIIHQLYAACDFFKQIIVLKPSDRCIMELKRWVDSRTGAFHWSHASLYRPRRRKIRPYCTCFLCSSPTIMLSYSLLNEGQSLSSFSHFFK